MKLVYAQQSAIAEGFGSCAIAIQNPTAPPLKVVHVGERAILSWQGEENAFALETIDPLSSPAQWVTVQTGSRNEIAVNLGVGSRFFRLSRKQF
jgi:hypothetical protein